MRQFVQDEVMCRRWEAAQPLRSASLPWLLYKNRLSSFCPDRVSVAARRTKAPQGLEVQREAVGRGMSAYRGSNVATIEGRIGPDA
jgi:hypothetical protein